MASESFLDLLLTKHFITIVLIIVCGLKLYTYKKTKDAEMHYFWLTVICCLLLVLEDVAESLAAMNPDLRFWRILLSVIGYDLRPCAAVGLLLVVCPAKKRSWVIWIPAIINLAVNLTAFFSPIVFSFDSNYRFVRGPLGYLIFAVALLYMVQILMLTNRRFRERKKTERWILIACAVSCIAASLIDMRYGGCRLNEAIMICCIFFFSFLRSHNNLLDPLTSLMNRFAFYEDLKQLHREISAIASIDMNGLKALNDTHGHQEGDKALIEIGRCLAQVHNRDTLSYRVGGDEFMILFLKQDKESVVETLSRVRADVAAAGYSISAGYAMKLDLDTIDDVLRASDRSMYSDKASYYQQRGIDRRRSRRPDEAKK